MRHHLSSGLFLLLCLAGCGGGGSPEQGQTPGTTISLGNASIQYFGAPNPAISMNSGGSTSVAMAGALFTSFLFNPPQDVTSLPILFTTPGGLMYTYQNSAFTQISSGDTGFIYSATYTPSGQILYVGFDQITQTAQLFICNGDGTSAKRLATNTYIASDSRAVMSPDGTKIIFDKKVGAFLGNLYLCSPTGLNVTSLAFGGRDPSWAPDSTTIVYGDTSTNGISKQTITGTQIVHIASQGTNAVFAPNGNSIAYYNNGFINVYTSDGSSYLGSNNAAPLTPAFSPDTKYLTYMQGSGPVTAGWTSANPVALPGIPSSMMNSISWAPFPKPKYFIGASGVVQATASGFVLSQSNNAFSSFFAFSATTPSTATIAPAASGSGSASVYTVAADAITLYRYMNGYSSTLVSVIPAANTKHVLVSINSNNGFVSFIAPFLETSGVHSASRQGDRLSYHAQFSAVFDAKGKNLALNGASDLTVDVKTGKLLSLTVIR